MDYMDLTKHLPRHCPDCRSQNLHCCFDGIIKLRYHNSGMGYKWLFQTAIHREENKVTIFCLNRNCNFEKEIEIKNPLPINGCNKGGQ